MSGNKPKFDKKSNISNKHRILPEAFENIFEECYKVTCEENIVKEVNSKGPRGGTWILHDDWCVHDNQCPGDSICLQNLDEVTPMTGCGCCAKKYK